MFHLVKFLKLQWNSMECGASPPWQCRLRKKDSKQQSLDCTSPLRGLISWRNHPLRWKTTRFNGQLFYKWVIVHSYVALPKGIMSKKLQSHCHDGHVFIMSHEKPRFPCIQGTFLSCCSSPWRLGTTVTELSPPVSNYMHKSCCC